MLPDAGAASPTSTSASPNRSTFACRSFPFRPDGSRRLPSNSTHERRGTRRGHRGRHAGFHIRAATSSRFFGKTESCDSAAGRIAHQQLAAMLDLPLPDRLPKHVAGGLTSSGIVNELDAFVVVIAIEAAVVARHVREVGSC